MTKSVSELLDRLNRSPTVEVVAVKPASDFFVVAVASNELIGNVLDGHGSDPLSWF
jgi:hypothetical protein